MSSIAILKSLSQYITIITGSGFTLFGIIGSLANIFIFSHRRFRTKPCSQYILIGSCINFVLAAFIIPSRVIVDGFPSIIFLSNGFTCKLRNYLGTYFVHASLWCTCLAVFDQWASTSRSARVRQWNSLKQARLLVIFTMVFWCLVASPTIPLSQVVLINGIWQCVILNRIYLNYYAYFLTPVGFFLLPLVVFSFFGFGTYIHIRNLATSRRSHRLERQFIRMILLQGALTVVSFLIYGAQFLYINVTSVWVKSSLWMAIDSVIIQIGRWSAFVNCVSAFYIYYGVSKRIRSIILKNLRILCFNNCRTNQVHINENHPMQQM